MTTETSVAWRSARIYYYEPDKTGLILDAVWPLFENLHGHVHGAYVLRHWRRGPHLRLNIKADRRAWTRTIQPAIDEVIGGYLAAHPSTAPIRERTSPVRQNRTQLAERGRVAPWFPDNTIQYAPYDDRPHVLTDPVAADMLSAFYTDTTPLLFQMLKRVRAGNDTAELIGLGLMLASSITAMPPITRSFVSYRSIAEGFIARCANPETTRTGFDACYQDNRTSFTNRTRAVIATLDGQRRERQGRAVPFVHEWADLIASYRDHATPLIAARKLSPPPLEDQTEASELNRTMFCSRAYQRAVVEDQDFSRYRLLINYTYLHISRLGLTPPQRFRLCHLAANAIEDLYDLNAIETIRSSSHTNAVL